MFKIGLKTWSTNQQYIQEAERLFKEGFCDYIELFAVPGSYQATASLWKALNIPFIIHAPHHGQGLNLSDPQAWEGNKKLALEAIKFADALNAEMIIFHPGKLGKTHEIIRQLNNFSDSRIVIENKPYQTEDEEVCNGYSPAEIESVMRQAGVGFCLDVEHALCAANSLQKDPIEYFKEFLVLKPDLFHLTDGHANEEIDHHMHLGQGTIDLRSFVSLFPKTCMVTVETVHDFEDKLTDFEQDVNYLRAMEQSLHEKR